MVITINGFSNMGQSAAAGRWEFLMEGIEVDKNLQG